VHNVLERLLSSSVNKSLEAECLIVNIIKCNVFPVVELYRKIWFLWSGFLRGSVMPRFFDVTSILESLAKFTRLSSTRAHRTLDRRSAELSTDCIFEFSRDEVAFSAFLLLDLPCELFGTVCYWPQ